MEEEEKDQKKPGSESIEDLEGLSDEELDGVSGGNCTSRELCCQACCIVKQCTGGGTCGGTIIGSGNEASLKIDPSDVELTPTEKT